jgi:hypothetical protein
VTPTYLVQASSNNEHFNADCDFAVVSLTPTLMKLIPKLQKTHADMKKRLKDFSSFEVADWGASFISRSTAEELLGESAFDTMDRSDGKPFLIPPRRDYQLTAIEANADYLVATGRGLWWRAHPKHSDIIVESDQIDWGWFTQCVHCGHPKDNHVREKCLFSPTSYKGLHATTKSSTDRRRIRKTA